MKPRFCPGDVVYIGVGHPAFRYGEQAIVTSFSQVDGAAPVLYRIKDAWGRWHWLEGWQISAQAPADAVGAWQGEDVNLVQEERPVGGELSEQILWCDGCTRVAWAADWLLASARCPYCQGQGGHDWPGIRQGQRDLPEHPTPGQVYRFRPAPGAPRLAANLERKPR